MEFQEFTGDNVDLAINEACTRLQVPSFELEYEVISKESAGFLGFGKKPARIRARKKEVQETVKAEPKQKQEPKKKEEKPVKKVDHKGCCDRSNLQRHKVSDGIGVL